MNSISFVKSKVDILVDSFPEIKCRYEHDVLSNTHIIEILPIHVYTSDDVYANKEIEIIDEFINNYPDESICFISEESLISVESPIFEKKGLLFGINEQYDIKGWRTINNLNQFNIASLSSITYVDMVKFPLITVPFQQIYFSHEISSFNFLQNKEILMLGDFGTTFTINGINNSESEIDYIEKSENLLLAA